MLGTACHVRGGARVLDYLENRLELKSGGTKDLVFTLESVNCLGACALGPMLVIDKKYYGKINPNKIESILEKIRAEEEVRSQDTKVGSERQKKKL